MIRKVTQPAPLTLPKKKQKELPPPLQDPLVPKMPLLLTEQEEKRGGALPGQSSKQRHHGRGGDSDGPSTPVSHHHRLVLPHLRMGTLVPRKLQQRGMSGVYPYPAPRGDVERIERPSAPRKETCRYFQWIDWKRCVQKEQLETPLATEKKLWKGGFVVGGSYNTIMFPEESASEAMQQFPEWKGMIYLSALTRYLKE